MDRRVAGYCPMGCGQTLFLGEGAFGGGHVTCSLVGCPDPGAADTLLAERETEHIVRIQGERFHVQHPLRERVHGDLLICDLHLWLSELPRAPREPGRYRVVPRNGSWTFTAID